MSVTAKIKTRLMRVLTINSWTRNIAIKMVRSRKKPELESIINEDITYNVEDVLSQINNKGFSGLVNISSSRLKNIINYSNTINFLSLENNNPYKINYDKPLKPGKSLWYGNSDIMDCKEIKELVYDKTNLEIASKYLGTTPTVKDVRMWWSFPQENKDHNHLYGFHYDIDAFKFLKQFIYLTDVDEKGGPHAIISNTHKRKSFFEKSNRRLTDAQVEKNYGKERINVMTAKAGEGFFEDTFAYHKGTTPETPRLILQIEYAL